MGHADDSIAFVCVCVCVCTTVCVLCVERVAYFEGAPGVGAASPHSIAIDTQASGSIDLVAAIFGDWVAAVVRPHRRGKRRPRETNS